VNTATVLSPAGAANTGARLMERIDAALSVASAREIFTADEVASLLGGIRAAAAPSDIAVVVAEILDDFRMSLGDSQLVGSARVADVLLDLRLAVATAPAVH
jgi:hypothetical protein